MDRVIIMLMYFRYLYEFNKMEPINNIIKQLEIVTTPYVSDIQHLNIEYYSDIPKDLKYLANGYYNEIVFFNKKQNRLTYISDVDEFILFFIQNERDRRIDKILS